MKIPARVPILASQFDAVSAAIDRRIICGIELRAVERLVNVSDEMQEVSQIKLDRPQACRCLRQYEFKASRIMWGHIVSVLDRGWFILLGSH